MDPATATAAIIAPWASYGVVGSVVIALGLWVWNQKAEIKERTAAHLADVKAYADKYAELLIENSKTQTALASAIERIGDKIKS